MQAKTNLEAVLLAHADFDFSNGWNKLNPDDLSSVLSSIGCAMFYMSIPLVWCSRTCITINFYQRCYSNNESNQ